MGRDIGFAHDEIRPSPTPRLALLQSDDARRPWQRDWLSKVDPVRDRDVSQTAVCRDAPQALGAHKDSAVSVCGAKARGGGMSEIEFIYAIECGDAIKIGRSWHPAARMKSLQSFCPLPFRLIGMIEGTHVEERELHSLCKNARIRGEWFRKEGAVLEFLRLIPPPPDDISLPALYPSRFGRNAAISE
jgi:hypothetical protein